MGTGAPSGSRGQSVVLGVGDGKAGAASCPGIVTRARECGWHVSRQRGQEPRGHAVASGCVTVTGTAVTGVILPDQGCRQCHVAPGLAAW